VLHRQVAAASKSSRKMGATVPR